MTPGLFSQRFGVGDALLIHGALASSRIWQGVAQGLAVDLPGHGRSADWAGTDYHADCTAAAASVCSVPCHMIGHSFGATVALRLAVERPHLCRSLTLIEPVFFAVARADNAPEIAAHDRAMVPYLAAVAAGDMAGAARAFIDVWGDGTPWTALPGPTREAIIRRLPLVVAGAPGIERDSAAMLAPGAMAALAVPVHLVRGGCTRPVVAAIHRGLMARLPQTRETVIAGAGHMAPVTHPGDVARAILG